MKLLVGMRKLNPYWSMVLCRYRHTDDQMRNRPLRSMFQATDNSRSYTYRAVNVRNLRQAPLFCLAYPTEPPNLPFRSINDGACRHGRLWLRPRQPEFRLP